MCVLLQISYSAQANKYPHLHLRPHVVYSVSLCLIGQIENPCCKDTAEGARAVCVCVYT